MEKIIDVAFVLLGAQHPAWFMLALAQAAIRRNPTLARGFLVWFGVREVTPLWLILFPGADGIVLSSKDAEPVPNHREPLVPASVPAHQYQENDGVPGFQELALPITEHKPEVITETEKNVAILVNLKKSDGKLYSANEIVEFVGGKRSDVLAFIRQYRAEETPKVEQPAASVRRPDGGWAVKH